MAVALIYADADTLAATADVLKLPHELPNVIAVHRVNDETFNHVDFIWATDAKTLVFDYIVDWMRQMEESEHIEYVRINDISENSALRKIHLS